MWSTHPVGYVRGSLQGEGEREREEMGEGVWREIYISVTDPTNSTQTSQHPRHQFQHLIISHTHDEIFLMCNVCNLYLVIGQKDRLQGVEGRAR